MYWAAFLAGLCNGIVLFILETLQRATRPESSAAPSVAWN